MNYRDPNNRILKKISNYHCLPGKAKLQNPYAMNTVSYMLYKLYSYTIIYEDITYVVCIYVIIVQFTAKKLSFFMFVNVKLISRDIKRIIMKISRVD